MAMAAVAAIGCSGARSRTVGCSKDTDCKDPRVCENTVCVDPRPVAGPAGSDDPRPTAGTGAPAAALAVTGSPPFAMFGGDARHTGRRGGPAPRTQPAPRWSAAVGGVVAGSPTIGPDGTIYVAAHDGGLYAFGPGGALKWKFAMGDRSWSTPAIAQDGTIYVGSDDDHLYAITSAGKLAWKLHLGACDPKGFGPESSRCDVDGGPTIGPDGTIYVGGDGIHAIWPNGTLRWKLATPEHVASTPAIGADGTVYAGCQDDALYAVTPGGKKRWEVRTGGDVDAAPAIGADGTIYVGSDDHALWSISPDGVVNWKVVTGAEIRGGAAISEAGSRGAPPVGAPAGDDTLYVGSLDGALYAIATTGQVRWKVAAADKIVATPGISVNGTILIGAEDEHLYAIAPDGTLLWLLALPGDVDTTPAIARDGTIYVAGDDAHLHAFR